MNNKILLDDKHILEYIMDFVNDSIIGTVVVNNARYHHNSSYTDAPNICKHGILTMQDIKSRGIKDYTDELIKLMDDIESHANGSDSVSLSVVGLDDLYSDEEEYDPFVPTKVDFLVDSGIKAGRNCTNYGNEFLSFGSIGVDSLRSVDIRLLKLVKALCNSKVRDIDSIKSIINAYNNLRHIALQMKRSKLDIPLREMSSKNNSMLDIDSISTAPQLILK